MIASIDRVDRAAWAAFAPPPTLTVSEWADRHRVMSAEASALPGRWRTATTPYLREIMDAVNDPRVETIVVQKSAQVGATEAMLNILLYSLASDPGPTMYLGPTLEVTSAISTDRLAPALRDCAVLRELVGAPRGRDAANAIFRKEIGHAILTLAGGNSPASVASRPVRLLFVDEADRIPQNVGAEGDPVTLAIKRTTAFRRRKIVIASTPTVRGASRIEDWMSLSDQRRYQTPCPRCSALFVMKWADVRWDDGDPATAYLECPECHARIDDAERPAMLAAGKWVATAPFAGIAGFHLWEGFSRWRSLREQVAAFLIARRSLEMRQAWTNTSLGELWEAPGESVEPSALLLRREDYGGALPAGVRLLTMGVDTQDDRLEALVVGWGDGEESWIVERVPLLGDPARADCWRELDELLGFEFPLASGKPLRVRCGLIDAGGHRTQAVYHAVIPRQVKGLFASFGRAGGEKGLLVSPPKVVRPANGTGSIHRRIVDVDQAKALIFARLRVSTPGPEYIHLPMTVGSAFVDELTAERLVTKRNKFGVPSKTWEQTRERNESLDCFVLALAALRILAPTPARFDRAAATLGVPRL